MWTTKKTAQNFIYVNFGLIHGRKRVSEIVDIIYVLRCWNLTLPDKSQLFSLDYELCRVYANKIAFLEDQQWGEEKSWRKNFFCAYSCQEKWRKSSAFITRFFFCSFFLFWILAWGVFCSIQNYFSLVRHCPSLCPKNPILVCFNLKNQNARQTALSKVF